MGAHLGAVCNNPAAAEADKKAEGDASAPAVQVVEAAPAPAVKEEPLLPATPLPHPAPITVDLNEPAVDPAAPIDQRDVDLVQQTWRRAALLGTETVGKVVFMNIFKIAPGALQLFPFKDDEGENLWKVGGRATAHANKVVITIDTAVKLLGDLGTLVPVLQSLGLRHVGYNVIPEHYDVVGQAVIASLGTALGDKFTEPVKNAWIKVYTTVKTVMCGDNYKVEVEECAAKVEEDAKAKAKAEAKKSSEAAIKKKRVDAKKKATNSETKAAEPEPEKKEAEDAAPSAEALVVVDRATIKLRDAEFKKLGGEAQKKAVTEILEAAKEGNIAQAKSMIEEGGLTPNASDGDGWTPLMKAAEAGKAEMCEFLLQQGSHTGLSLKLGEWGMTAFHFAARNNHVEVMEVLCKYGKKKDLAITNHNKKTARDYANAECKKIMKKVK